MKSSKAAARNLADFRQAHDPDVIVPTRLRTTLAEMLKEDPENWMYEGDLLKRANVSTTNINAYREQFSGHVVEIRGRNAKRAWFADPKVAAKVRGI